MKRFSNRYLDKIISHVGVRDAVPAIQAFVKLRRGSSDSLETVARNFGVTEISEERLPFEGGLFREAGRLRIKLNSDSPPHRRRFTLAHEIGHLFVDTIPGRKSRGHNDLALEYTCNLIAAELLMPAEEAVAFIRGLGKPCPTKLPQIASRFDVSVEAAARRVHKDLRLWRSYAGCWGRRENDQLETLWYVGMKRWDRLEPDAYSFELALDSDGPVATTELWSRLGGSDPVWLNLFHVGSNRVLGLVDFLR